MASQCKAIDIAVVGAGPAGVQLSILLHTIGVPHIVFEQHDAPGSFFRDYPRHRALISINKPNTGSGDYHYNMRHDWHSLLHAPNCTELYPHADCYVRYMQHIATVLPIKYRTRVSVSPHLSLVHTPTHCFHAAMIVIASGYTPTRLDFSRGQHLVDTYANMSVDANAYRNKSVLILGHGNAAYETAAFVANAASHVHVIGRSKQTTVWNTHYPGDMRTRNGVAGMYFLKSQVVIGEAEGGFVKQHGFVQEVDKK